MAEFRAQTSQRAAGENGTAVGIIELHGQLDGAATAAVDQAYTEAATPPPAALVLDFAGVDYINSTGIALVVGLLAKARAGGIEVRACGLSEHYRHIFEITRLVDFMSFFPDGDAAVLGGAVEPGAAR